MKLPTKPEIVFIIADGLSAIAPQRYAVPVIKAAFALLEGWQIGPLIIAEQARVALGDEVGELLGAEITVTLVGERPGLSAPDSLGIYLTYAPRIGRTDAERNCISNVREEGTGPEQAARTLHYLLNEFSPHEIEWSAAQRRECRTQKVGGNSRKDWRNWGEAFRCLTICESGPIHRASVRRCSSATGAATSGGIDGPCPAALQS